MTEHARTRFLPSAFDNFARDNVADSAQSKFAAFNIAFNLLPIFRARAFGDNNERAETASGFPLLYRLSNFVVIKRNLRNQNDVRAASDAAVKRDPASVPSHNFANNQPYVTR